MKEQVGVLVRAVRRTGRNTDEYFLIYDEKLDNLNVHSAKEAFRQAWRILEKDLYLKYNFSNKTHEIELELKKAGFSREHYSRKHVSHRLEEQGFTKKERQKILMAQMKKLIDRGYNIEAAFVDGFDDGRYIHVDQGEDMIIAKQGDLVVENRYIYETRDEDYDDD